MKSGEVVHGSELEYPFSRSGSDASSFLLRSVYSVVREKNTIDENEIFSSLHGVLSSDPETPTSRRFEAIGITSEVLVNAREIFNGNALQEPES